MTREDVLAAIVPNRAGRRSIRLRAGVRRQLRDRDAQLGLLALEHVVAARASLGGADAPFPLVADFIQDVLRKIGQPVGIKRARAMRQMLVAVDALTVAGEYRQPYRRRAPKGSYLVPLYRVAFAVRRVPLPCKACVGRGRGVKSPPTPRWWQVGLFADLYGLPPPGYTKAQLRRMRSADERMRTWGAAAWT